MFVRKARKPIRNQLHRGSILLQRCITPPTPYSSMDNSIIEIDDESSSTDSLPLSTSQGVVADPSSAPEEYIKEQEEYIRFWEERKKRELEDARLASLLNTTNTTTTTAPAVTANSVEDESVSSTTTAASPPSSINSVSSSSTSTTSSYNKVDPDLLLALRIQQEEQSSTTNTTSDITTRTKPNEDLLLALKIQKEEEELAAQRELERKRLIEMQDAELARKVYEEESALEQALQKLAQQDADLAKRLMEEEIKAQKEEEQKLEWEKTLAFLRNEIKCESDEEMARLLKEKEELERKLREQEERRSLGGPSITLSTIQYPNDWVHQRENHTTITIEQGTTEWHRVSSKFREGMGNTNVLKIVRNQNRTLWMWYYLRKKQMDMQNHSDGANEHLCFHGSRSDAYKIIMAEGFDHRISLMSGAIGAGIYFAESSATSNGYVRSRGRHKMMLLCRVAAGSVGGGKVGLRRPPEKKPRRGDTPPILYDSVGNLNGNGVVVVFENTQAYPEYLITYR